MDAREIVIGLGVATLLLGALTLAFAARKLVKRRRAGLSWFWGGLVLRVVVIAALLYSGVATLLHLPPPPFANRAAPGASDAIIVIHTQNAYRATDIVTNQVQGVSARSGAVRWTRTLSQVVGAVVAGPPGMTLVVGGNGGGVSVLYALRTADGALLWSRADAGLYLYGYIPKPGLASDRARVFALLQQPAGPALVALSARDGALLWSIPTAYYDLPLSMVADGSALYTATTSGEDQQTTWRVTAWRATDGAQLWSVSPPPSTDPQADDRQPLISVAGGRVFVAPRQDRVTALDAQTGATLWNAVASPFASNPLDPLATLASGDTLYVAGQLLQPVPAPGASGAGTSTLSAFRVAALDATTGAPRWTAALDVMPLSLSLGDGALVIGGGDGGVETFTAANGALQWDSARSLDNLAPWALIRLQYTPLVSGGTVYLINNELDPSSGFCLLACAGLAWLYAADAHSGTLWWRVRMGPTSLTHVTL